VLEKVAEDLEVHRVERAVLRVDVRAARASHTVLAAGREGMM
jgi:hypothetical protein